MDTATGVVISIEETLPGARRALVGVAAQDVCRRCAEGRGCGAGVFGRREQERRLEVAIPDGYSVRPGQRVTLAIEPRRLFAASLIVYGLPLAGTAIGAASAQAFAAGDGASVAGAMAGFAAAAVAARRHLAGRGCTERLAPRIVG